MEQGPVVKGLDCVVGSVERAPSRGMQQVSAIIEILLGEPLARDGIRAQKFPFHQGPARRSQRGVDGHGDVFRPHLGGAQDQQKKRHPKLGHQILLVVFGNEPDTHRVST